MNPEMPSPHAASGPAAATVGRVVFADALPAQARRPFPWTFAFQPYVDTTLHQVIGHEALLRGHDGQLAAEVFATVADGELHAFDVDCRGAAIRAGKALGIDALGQSLSINVLPNALGKDGQWLEATLRVAEDIGFPSELLVLELTEVERVVEPARLRAVLRDHAKAGFRTAIDDLGAGWASLTLLVDLRPDFVKLDQTLVNDLDLDTRRRSLVRGLKQACDDLGCLLIAEGVERAAQSRVLDDMGIFMQQGFLFARPSLGSLGASPYRRFSRRP